MEVGGAAALALEVGEAVGDGPELVGVAGEEDRHPLVVEGADGGIFERNEPVVHLALGPVELPLGLGQTVGGKEDGLGAGDELGDLLALQPAHLEGGPLLTGRLGHHRIAGDGGYDRALHLQFALRSTHQVFCKLQRGL